MNSGEARSRRDLIATVTGGALLGALWGAAFPIVATERRPTVSVVGHQNAQVILIDSSSARVLMLSGEPDDELLEALPAIMTVFRQRVDLLVAPPRTLADRGIALRQRWRIRHAISLGKGHVPPPSALSTTSVQDTLEVSLDEETRLLLRIGYRDNWRADVVGTGTSLWCATLDTPAGRITIAPDVPSIAAIGPPTSVLMIVPDAPAPEILARSPAAGLAVNYDSNSLRTPPAPGPALTRIYPRDVARIVIAGDHLELPEWTAIPTASPGS